MWNVGAASINRKNVANFRGGKLVRWHLARRPHLRAQDSGLTYFLPKAHGCRFGEAASVEGLFDLAVLWQSGLGLSRILCKRFSTANWLIVCPRLSVRALNLISVSSCRFLGSFPSPQESAGFDRQPSDPAARLAAAAVR